MMTSTCSRTSAFLRLGTPPADRCSHPSRSRTPTRFARFLALGLLLAFAAAAPAAANRRVHVVDNDLTFPEELITPAVWGFQCSGPVYHGILSVHEDLWLWYPNDFSSDWI